MSEQRAKGWLLAAVLWCVILGILGAGYKFLVHPYFSRKLKSATGSSSQYKNEILLAADSFSGYCVLRSDAFKQALKARQIKLTVQDDKADYAARLKSLQDGKVQLAVFTIDSLIAASAKAGDFPGTIILVLDETKGGDAIVADRNAIPSLEQLNDPAARFVLTPNSPSEFLARVLIAHFNLPRLPEKWWIPADGAAAVYKALRSASPTEKRAYVLWEPYVSKALEKPGMQVLLDSSKIKGYIVDVLVAERQFLRDQPALVKAVVEDYCRAAYAYAQLPDGMVNLVREDARVTGSENLDTAQAKQIAAGVQWKNTLENYAHFGLLTGVEQGGLTPLEDMIGNVIDVLVKTRGLTADPLPGQHHTLFYNTILQEMRSASFHPGRGMNLISGLQQDTDLEKVRTDPAAAELSPEQWNKMRPLGQLRVEPIVFARGSAQITVQSEHDLEELARRLASYPQLYLKVIGHTRAEGDPEANRQLAVARAEAAANFLLNHGVVRSRLRTGAAPTSVSGGAAQAVSFEVVQVPY